MITHLQIYSILYNEKIYLFNSNEYQKLHKGTDDCYSKGFVCNALPGIAQPLVGLPLFSYTFELCSGGMVELSQYELNIKQCAAQQKKQAENKADQETACW